MSISARRNTAVTAMLLAVAAFFALSVATAAGSGSARADGIITVRPTPPAHPDGAIWD